MTTQSCDVKTVRCAGCGKLREQANHWFLISTDFGFYCYPFDIVARKRTDVAVCGQACAQKEFERWMTAVRNAALQGSGPNHRESRRGDRSREAQVPAPM